MSQPTTTASKACDQCGKTQEELQEPLKRCAKCGSEQYCSRECQRLAWPQHRQLCGVPGSLTNPPKSEIAQHATKTIELMEALCTLPGFSKTNAAATTPAILRHTFGFLVTTYNDYWTPLLQPLLSVELASRIPLGDDPEPEKKKARMLAKFDEIERESDGGFDRMRWPTFQREKYTDALGRNTMACLMIKDEAKTQAMYGGGSDSRGWTFGEHVKAVARGMMKDED